MQATKRRVHWTAEDANGISVDPDGADVRISCSYPGGYGTLDTVAELAARLKRTDLSVTSWPTLVQAPNAGGALVATELQIVQRDGWTELYVVGVATARWRA